MIEKKKNDQHYIIPAAYFKNTTTDKSSVSPVHTATNHHVAHDIMSNKTTTTYTQETVKQPVSNTLNDKIATHNEPQNSPSTNNSSVEERRKALLDKSKKHISGLSIKGITAKKNHVAQNKPEQVEQKNLPVQPLVQDQVQEVWNTYAKQLRNKGQQILASILNADQPIVENNSLKLRFPNQSMKEDLEKEQGNLLEYLKKELQNYEIHLDIQVDKSVQKKYVFTEKEKYMKLVEKNPLVDELRKAFDLEL